MNNRHLILLGLSGYVFIGTAAVLVPSLMPAMTAEFAATGLTIAAIGLIFPARAVGGILGNLLSGIASDLLGRQQLVWLPALFLAASLALTAMAKPWVLFVGGFIVISAAQGALATGINALIADANPGARARMLNLLHGVYGAGAAVSPLVIGWLIDRGLVWRWALTGTALIWLVYGVVARQVGRVDMTGGQQRSTPTLNLGMLKDGPFLALFMIGFVYNGVAFSLLGWIALFTQRAAGASTVFSVGLISVFYVALTGGRFICAAFTERLGYARTLLALACASGLAYPLVVVGLNSALALAGMFLTGFSLSGLFPTALAFGARLYPRQTGTVSGTLSVALTLGGMLPPLWTGMVADAWSFQGALAVNYLLLPPLILIALYLGRVEARSGERPAVIESSP